MPVIDHRGSAYSLRIVVQVSPPSSSYTAGVAITPFCSASQALFSEARAAFRFRLVALFAAMFKEPTAADVVADQSRASSKRTVSKFLCPLGSSWR